MDDSNKSSRRNIFGMDNIDYRDEWGLLSQVEIVVT